MSGAAITYYYTFTGWDVIRPDDNPPGYQMFKTLNNYFNSVDWWNYEPRPDLLMWTPSRCLKHKTLDKYVFITNNRGRLLIDYPIETSTYSGSWLNPFTSEVIELKDSDTVVSECNPKATIFTSPYDKKGDGTDFVILTLSVN